MPKISKKMAPYTHSLTGQQIRKLDQVKKDAPSKLAVFNRAYSGKRPGAGIKAMCLDCLGLEAKAIRECASSNCPLWPYRPYRSDPGKAVV